MSGRQDDSLQSSQESAHRADATPGRRCASSVAVALRATFRGTVQENREDRGFTLMEAVVVLVLIGIMAAVAIPRLADMDSGLDTEAEILRSHLRYAQSMAMANNVAVWTVNIGANSYSVLRDGAAVDLPGDNSPNHVFPGGIAATPAAFTLDYLGSPGINDVLVTLNDAAGRTVVVTMLGYTGFIQ